MLILKISFHFRMQDFLAKPEFRDRNWAQIMEHAKYLVTMDLARVNFEYDQVRNLIGLSTNYTMEDEQISEREKRQAFGKHNHYDFELLSTTWCEKLKHSLSPKNFL